MPLDEPGWWYREGADGVATCLAPLGTIYGWAARRRYHRTVPYRSRLPVLCVGNFTAGGTGKTPLVIHLCKRLLTAGRHPVALTRGYGGRHIGPHWVDGSDSASEVGDEALLLARVAPTLIARDRAVGAHAIEARSDGADVIVMDDGLQNPQLAKDLTFAVVDGGRGLGNGRVIPAGPLRAPLEFQLELTDAIVVNEATPAAGEDIAVSMRHRFNGPILRAATVAAGDASFLKARRVIAWAGIGAPKRFFAMLEALGANPLETIAFRDHQPLAQADADRLLGLGRRHRAMLVSTEKDLARLQRATGSLAELAAATRALPVKLQFAKPDAERLAVLIESAVEGHGRRIASC